MLDLVTVELSSYYGNNTQYFHTFKTQYYIIIPLLFACLTPPGTSIAGSSPFSARTLPNTYISVCACWKGTLSETLKTAEHEYL